MPKLIINSYEDIEKQLLEYARADAFISKKEAELNAKIQNLKEKFDDETKEVRATKNLIENEIYSFCVQHKADFIKQRTMQLIYGKIGFRINPPKVNLLNRKYNIKTAIELIKKIFGEKYIRTKEEIDKEAILSDYAQEVIDDSKLAGVGLRVDKDETFFIEPDWEKLQNEKISLSA